MTTSQGFVPSFNPLTIADTAEVAVATTQPASEADLQQRIAKLPQELYDIIRDMAFEAHITFTGPQEYDVQDLTDRARYCADLRILQLDRHTRFRYAGPFYRLRTFCTRSIEMVHLESCLRSMPEDHSMYIAEIVCRFPMAGKRRPCSCQRQRRVQLSKKRSIGVMLSAESARPY